MQFAKIWRFKGLHEHRDKCGQNFNGPKYFICQKKKILLNDFKNMCTKYVEYYELSKEIST